MYHIPKQIPMIQDIIESQDCVGCGACAEICPKKCIELTVNKEGFKYPTINTEQCINCKQCRKVCPALNSEKVKLPKGKVYAAVNKNHSILMESSSGGIFSSISQFVLNHNGIVFGAAFDKNMILIHSSVDNKKDLERLRGSKYLQSDIQNVFKKIRKLISEKRYVYFVGTSCQVAALRLFLKTDSEFLITSDLICHGVPSPKAFNIFLKEIERKKNIKIIQYKFRDKSINGWNCSSSTAIAIDNKNNHIKKIYYNSIQNAYFTAFINGALNRECCYKCKFTTEKRVSDITLADFWGINMFSNKFHCDYGVSLVIINSDKGNKVFNDIKDTIIIQEATYEQAKVINKCLYESTPRPNIRNHIYDNIDENPYSIIDPFIKKGIDTNYIKFIIKKILRTNPKLYKILYTIKNKVL